MDKKTKGAWVIHHARKLESTLSQDFDAIGFSGKSGTLLSAISAEKQLQIPQGRLEALAKANNISPKTELPSILTELDRQRLINRGTGAIEVIGMTGQGVLEATARIFDETSHEKHEEIVIRVSDAASENPLTDSSVVEELSDEFKLQNKDVLDTLQLGCNIGFFDSEAISATEKLLFNGNLFRREDARKINGVLSTIEASEASRLNELNAKLQASGCLPLQTATDILGKDLFDRLHSIGMFDVNVVGNNLGKSHFVMRPSAFSKFSDSIADDALDLAKALVASLTYGMTISNYYRGRIQMVSALMNKLIAGGTVGPATAIGNDYQALEFKGVVEVTPEYGGTFSMRLLKPEVGRLALAVIQKGDLTAETVANLPGAKVTEYVGPEVTREVKRKHSTEAVKLKAKNLLQEIRMGGLSK
jgi:hypothetical protein